MSENSTEKVCEALRRNGVNSEVATFIARLDLEIARLQKRVDVLESKPTPVADEEPTSPDTTAAARRSSP